VNRREWEPAGEKARADGRMAKAVRCRRCGAVVISNGFAKAAHLQSAACLSHPPVAEEAPPKPAAPRRTKPFTCHACGNPTPWDKRCPDGHGHLTCPACCTTRHVRQYHEVDELEEGPIGRPRRIRVGAVDKSAPDEGE